MSPEQHGHHQTSHIPPPDHIPEVHSRFGGLLREAVFGFNDGLVSTFAIIAALHAGHKQNETILLAALAVLIAGAFSMGLGTFLGTKSERDLYERERKREIWEMEKLPAVEKQEIRDIYEKKGFHGELLEKITDHIIKDKKLWLETMMKEELGFAEEPPKPILHGVTMAFAFIVGASLPTLPYLAAEGDLFVIAAMFSTLGLLTVGALKTYFTGKNVVSSALETFLVGAIAAGSTYFIGSFFGS